MTNDWIENKFNYNSKFYELICWELMFPSWEINNNKGKWDEPSIDFIFYNEETSEFLCVELKNEIKDRRSLLSGFCQVSYSAIQFKKQYSIDKIKRAQFLSYKSLNRESVKKINENYNIQFCKSPKIKRILMAKKFLNNSRADKYFNLFNSLNFNDLISEISNYSDSKVFGRIKSTSREDFDSISELECHKVRIH